MNNKGVVDPATMLIVTVAAFAVTCTGLTYAVGSKDLAKKNWNSIVAHVKGQCTGATPDAACINK